VALELLVEAVELPEYELCEVGVAEDVAGNSTDAGTKTLQLDDSIAGIST
jgi:hypothetical protein